MLISEFSSIPGLFAKMVLFQYYEIYIRFPFSLLGKVSNNTRYTITFSSKHKADVFVTQFVSMSAGKITTNNSEVDLSMMVAIFKHIIIRLDCIFSKM